MLKRIKAGISSAIDFAGSWLLRCAVSFFPGGATGLSPEEEGPEADRPESEKEELFIKVCNLLTNRPPQKILPLVKFLEKEMGPATKLDVLSLWHDQMEVVADRLFDIIHSKSKRPLLEQAIKQCSDLGL